MIRHRTAVTTEDDHQPGVTGNYFERDMEPKSKGAGSCEEDHVHLEKWRRWLVGSAYLRARKDE
jgi:hypothetical protein